MKARQSREAKPSAILRGQAEKALRARRADVLRQMSPRQVERLVHELRVHQIELEMQNEELRQAQMELAQSHDRLNDLYDFAPVSYLTLDARGAILEANLTAAKLLAVSRPRLRHQKLSDYVARRAQDELYLHQQAVFGSKDPQRCELPCLTDGGAALTLQLESTAFEDPVSHVRLCHTALIDVTSRRQAEQALREREERYRLLFEANPNPMFVFAEKSLRLLDVNESMVRQYGWTRAELLRMKATDLRPPEDVARLAAALPAQRGSRATFVGEWRHRRKDGTLFDAEITVSCLEYAGQEARLVLVNDITERKRAEEALRESEERFRAIFRQASDSIVVVDPQTLRPVEFNDEACQRLGYTRKEFGRLTLSDLDVIESTCDTQRRCAKVIRKGLEVFETRQRTKSGEVRDVEVRATPIRIGNQTLLQGFWRDITDRKRLERHLRESAAELEQRVKERTAQLTRANAQLKDANAQLKDANAQLKDANERFRAITDTSMVGIITLDERGEVQSVNRAVCGMFGYAPDELIGHSVTRLLPLPGHEQHDGFVANYVRTGGRKGVGIRREMVGRHKDGTEFPFELSMAEFIARGRRCFAGTIHDIRRRRQMEVDLAGSIERARREIGHELHDGLGQHLQGMRYLATDLERRLTERGVPEAAELGRFSRLLQEGIEQARDVARGLRPVENVPEGLMAGLRDLARTTRVLHRKDVRFICRQRVLVTDNLVATHLFRIAQEAVNNSLKHAGCKSIKITLSTALGRILLAVKDDGVGLKRPRGAGVGLHVMQYRANAIRGSLIVQSTPGGGTDIVCSVAQKSVAEEALSRSLTKKERQHMEET